MPPLQPPERRSGQTKEPATAKNLIPINRAVAASLADRQQSLQSAVKTAFLEVSNCLAIRDGETPALKAARTALTLAGAKGGPNSRTGLR